MTNANRFTIGPMVYIFAAKPPKVTSQPMSQSDVLPGKEVAFSVQATGTLPLKYQWQWNCLEKRMRWMGGRISLVTEANFK